MLALCNLPNRPEGLDAVRWLADWVQENAVKKPTKVDAPIKSEPNEPTSTRQMLKAVEST